MKLYGLIIQAMPAWLQTSVFNSHKGKGLEALTYLRTPPLTQAKETVPTMHHTLLTSTNPSLSLAVTSLKTTAASSMTI